MYSYETPGQRASRQQDLQFAELASSPSRPPFFGIEYTKTLGAQQQSPSPEIGKQTIEEVFDNGANSDNDDDLESAIPNVKTFVRSEAPRDLVNTSASTNAGGVSIDVTLHSNVSSGGGVMKGTLRVLYNPKSKRNRTTQVSKIQLDCLGVESVKGHEPNLFFSIAQDILTDGIYLHDLTKMFLQEEHVKIGQCVIPFEIQLPLDVGPGTFEVKDAEIAYSLVVSVLLNNNVKFPKGKVLRVTKRIKLYPCLDPQRVLVPAQAPIDTSAETRVRFGGKDTLKVAARIHRPSWMAGQIAYVDVSATNDSTRDVYKIQLDLVRHVSFYKNAAASSAFQSVDMRLPEKTLTKTVSSNTLTIKSDKCDNPDWKGIKAGSRETVVCQIQVPGDQLSVSAGRYFDVRYMIVVLICTKGGEAQVELPISIIHINSLDVMPSSAKEVCRMISTYVDPVPKASIKECSATRRSSMPHLFGTAALVTKDKSVRPVDALSSRYSSDIPRTSSLRRPSLTTQISSHPTVLDNTPGSPIDDLAKTKPGIQCDLRRALSLDYQTRFSKLDISAERASYTQGAPLAQRSPDRKRRDLSENLAHRLRRERTRNASFYDVV